MLRLTIYDGTHKGDFCDYCRKDATGKEVLMLQVSGKRWADGQSIQIHTQCLERLAARSRAEQSKPVETIHDQVTRVTGIPEPEATK